MMMCVKVIVRPHRAEIYESWDAMRPPEVSGHYHFGSNNYVIRSVEYIERMERERVERGRGAEEVTYVVEVVPEQPRRCSLEAH